MNAKPVSVAVLISAGRHPLSGMARACRGDVVALAVGRQLAGDRLSVVHAGRGDEPSLPDYLAHGAAHITVLDVAAGRDVVQPLAAQLATTDVILTGCRSEQGAGSGVLPYALAQALQRPVAGNVLDVSVHEGELRLRQFLPKGKRRGLAVSGPVVLAIHPLAAVEVTYAYARRLAGKVAIKNVVAKNLEAGKLEADQSPDAAIGDTASGVTVCAARRPVRLKAEVRQAGHLRLQSAIVSEAKGGVVAFDGSPVDKAQIMLNYLRQHHLVDF